jgi:hypothetical protein
MPHLTFRIIAYTSQTRCYHDQFLTHRVRSIAAATVLETRCLELKFGMFAARAKFGSILAPALTSDLSGLFWHTSLRHASLTFVCYGGLKSKAVYSILCTTRCFHHNIGSRQRDQSTSRMPATRYSSFTRDTGAMYRFPPPST